MFLGVGQEGQFHVALVVGLGSLLADIAVRFLQFFAGFPLFGFVALVQYLAGSCEKRIVETDDVGFTPPVGIQGTASDAEAPVLFQSGQNLPVTVPPAVDALFDVAYNHASFLLRQAFLQQQAEVFPLHA